MSDQANWISAEYCPICGELHELRWQYNGAPLMVCPDAPPDKVVLYKDGKAVIEETVED